MYCIVSCKVHIFASHSIITDMSTNENNSPNAQMRKGVLELCILAILSGKDAYPTEIIEKLKDVKLVVVEGTLYPMLMRLKNGGYLIYRWEESSSGPPRKYYSLSDEGRKYLEELRAAWNDLIQSVNKIIL
jgi:PadR family transcriptional regulator PadR